MRSAPLREYAVPTWKLGYTVYSCYNYSMLFCQTKNNNRLNIKPLCLAPYDQCAVDGYGLFVALQNIASIAFSVSPWGARPDRNLELIVAIDKYLIQA